MLYFLDANVIRSLVHEDDGFENILIHITRVGADACALSTLVYHELQASALSHRLTKADRSAISALLSKFWIYDFDLDAAFGAARVKAYLEGIGKPSGAVDMMLAGHVLARKAVIVTANIKHFRHVPGLVVENWLKALERPA